MSSSLPASSNLSIILSFGHVRPRDSYDVVQEVFLKIFPISGLFGIRAVKNVIYRIAVNEFNNYRRWFFRHKRQEVVLEDEVRREDSAMQIDRRARSFNRRVQVIRNMNSCQLNRQASSIRCKISRSRVRSQLLFWLFSLASRLTAHRIAPREFWIHSPLGQSRISAILRSSDPRSRAAQRWRTWIIRQSSSIMTRSHHRARNRTASAAVRTVSLKFFLHHLRPRGRLSCRLCRKKPAAVL